MGKKRKAGQPFGAQKNANLSEENSRARFNINETFDNSENELHAEKDQVLFDTSAQAKRRRVLEEQNIALQPSDEEILGYESSNADSEDTDADHDNQNGHGATQQGADGYDISESESQDLGNHENIGDNLRDWGTTRQSYYDADVIETEADALEEEIEAKRLQQKQLEGMREVDFGFDENEWAGEGAVEADGEIGKGTVYEKLPDLIVTGDIDDAEKLKILKNRYPEFEQLAKDFLDLQPRLETLRIECQAAEALIARLKASTRRKANQPNEEIMLQTSPAVTIFRVLSSYLGSIAMYFALLTSTAYLKHSSEPRPAMTPADLRNHPIVPSLVRFRQLWVKVRDTPLPPSEAIGSINRMDEELLSQESQTHNGREAANPGLQSSSQSKRTRKKKLSKSQKAILAIAKAQETQKAARIAKTEADLADLSSLIRPSRLQQPPTVTSRPPQDNYQDSDFGDEAPLTTAEAAEKAQRKKTLRFYTSQIAQKANRRGARGRDAAGDMDLPYKERVIDKRERLNREAQKRGREGNHAADLITPLGNSAESGDDVDEERLAEKIRHEADAAADAEGYYQRIDSASRAKKAAREAAYTEAAKQGGIVHEDERVGSDGKRAIGYEIQKNKGLMPKRKKEVRNPRVKKKLKFAEKVKKLGSIRPVHKSGRGNYGGELTGINRSVVRSVKL